MGIFVYFGHGSNSLGGMSNSWEQYSPGKFGPTESTTWLRVRSKTHIPQWTAIPSPSTKHVKSLRIWERGAPVTMDLGIADRSDAMRRADDRGNKCPVGPTAISLRGTLCNADSVCIPEAAQKRITSTFKKGEVMF